MSNRLGAHRRSLLRAGRVLLLSAAASIALASPATRPAEKPARQTAEILSAQGMAALSAQDAKSSLDAFLDALQLIKTDKTITQLDPARANRAQDGDWRNLVHARAAGCRSGKWRRGNGDLCHSSR